MRAAFAVMLFPWQSLPTRGAWIEILMKARISFICPWSLPTRGAWIEIWKQLIKNAIEIAVASRTLATIAIMKRLKNRKEGK